jgi:hypothetical protein
LNFLEPKDKSGISVIIDKQIKYFFYLKKLIKIYPDAKYIVLVRDPRVNAITKKNRKLNSGQNPLYLSALWNYTYSNIYFLEAKNKAVLTVRYEDLVSSPESTLKNVCQFLNIPYVESMIHTEGVYEAFLNMREDKTDPGHISYLKNFQSSLFNKVTKEKVHLEKGEINDEINDKIIRLTKRLLHKFNYDSTLKSKGTPVTLNLKDNVQILKAYLYRPVLLYFYLRLPLKFKLAIKKIKSIS